MIIIEISALENGAHRNQTVSGVVSIPDGWAVIPDNMEIPASFPFVNIEADGKTVTSMTAGVVPGPDIETERAVKIAAMSAACNAAITGGVDVELSDGITYHFRLTEEDQINLYTIKAMADAGVEKIPYHADDGWCQYYSAADALAIADAATSWKLYHQSYFNSLKQYILSLETAEEIDAVTYGMDIPEQFQSDVLKDLIGGTT